MDRLTEKHYTGNGYYLKCSAERECPFNCEDCHKLDEAIDRLAAYEDTGLTPEAVDQLKLASMGKAVAEITEFEGVPVARLAELARADKDGRVVVLPYQIGRAVYVVRSQTSNGKNLYLRKERIDRYVVSGFGVFMCFESGRDSVQNRARETSVFLTREEAEKALEEMKGDG